jgi:bifunctional DNA-binding transcriptional regulator/antitoxin component of YhaV-PrlF toxin-antitoxin module
MTMTRIAKTEAKLVVPSNLQRRAGIKPGDRLKFSVAPRTITITAVSPSTYKPTKAELSAIRKGEAEAARGEYVTLAELLDDLEGRRKGGTKTARKVSR